MKVSINWLKEYVTVKSSAKALAHELTMAGLEVQHVTMLPNRDIVLSVEITSNRPDWLSHIGIAREISAVSGASLKYPEIILKHERIPVKRVAIKIKDNDLCPFYTAVLLENVTFAETPQFIKDRLEAIEVRSINLPVDLTNYVLFEYGQPLHAFDYDKIGDTIIIRRAKKGETFHAINDKKYTLCTDDLIICDEQGPIAIGGVMGGLHSEVRAQTKNILLESAFFNPVAIRNTSRRLQLTSESSYRFERRVDPLGVVNASDRFVQLLSQYGTIGNISAIVQAGKAPFKQIEIQIEAQYVNDSLGTTITPKKIIKILNDLGIKIAEQNSHHMRACIPSFRADLARPIDLVEEIARIHGYAQVPETYPVIVMSKKQTDDRLKIEDTIRSYATALGTQEVITFSLVNPHFYETFAPDTIPKAVTLINPSNKELTIMRPSLLSGMLEILKRNIHHGIKDVKAFEIGRVYRKAKGKQLPDEERVLGLIMTGYAFSNWFDHTRELNFFDLKGRFALILERLGIAMPNYEPIRHSLFHEAVQSSVKGTMVGHFGQLSAAVLDYFDIKQPVWYGEFKLDPLMNALTTSNKYIEISKFPASYRDLSIVVAEHIQAKDMIDVIKKAGGNLIKKLALFDKYTGKQIPPGSVSLTFSLEYQADDRTLSSEEIEAVHTTIVQALEKEFQATLRT